MRGHELRGSRRRACQLVACATGTEQVEHHVAICGCMLRVPEAVCMPHDSGAPCIVASLWHHMTVLLHATLQPLVASCCDVLRHACPRGGWPARAGGQQAAALPSRSLCVGQSGQIEGHASIFAATHFGGDAGWMPQVWGTSCIVARLASHEDACLDATRCRVDGTSVLHVMHRGEAGLT